MSTLKKVIWPQIILFGDSITQVTFWDTGQFGFYSLLWHAVFLFQFAFQANGWGSEISHKLARYRFDDSTDVLLHSYRCSMILSFLSFRKCDVVNRGLSGYNTRWAKIVLPRIVPASDAPIAAVTVFFGANDCALEGKNISRVVLRSKHQRQWYYETLSNVPFQTRTPRSTCLSRSSRRI